MKGKTLVIAIVLFVLLVVGAIYFAMTATINKIEKEGAFSKHPTEIYEVEYGGTYKLS